MDIMSACTFTELKLSFCYATAHLHPSSSPFGWLFHLHVCCKTASPKPKITCFTVLILETSYSYITDFLACVDLNNEFMQKLFSEAYRQLQYMYYVTAGRESTFTPCERKT